MVSVSIRGQFVIGNFVKLLQLVAVVLDGQSGYVFEVESVFDESAAAGAVGVIDAVIYGVAEFASR